MNASRSGVTWHIRRFCLLASEVIYMASKRKKRRQRQRAQEKRIIKEMTTSPETAKKQYKEYRVAVQKKTGDPIHIITIKEHDDSKLLGFIARIYGVADPDELAFLDIHLIMKDGNVAIIVDGGAWPKGAKTITESGFTIRGKDRPLVVRTPTKSTPKPDKTVNPVSSVMLEGHKDTFIKSKRYKAFPIPVNSEVKLKYG